MEDFFFVVSEVELIIVLIFIFLVFGIVVFVGVIFGFYLVICVSCMDFIEVLCYE